MAGIVVSLLTFGVSLNIDGAFPAFDKFPVIVQALILGFTSGLFMELGKFLVLDRMMPAIRKRKNGLLFGMGWSGVAIILMSIVLAFGVFGMQDLANTKDLASAVPNANSEQLNFLQESQKQIQELAAGSPLKAFTPLLESAATLLVDMGLTLLIILGLNKKQTRHTWLAVGVRAILSAGVFYASQVDSMPVEIIFAIWVLIGAFLIFYFQKRLQAMKV